MSADALDSHAAATALWSRTAASVSSPDVLTVADDLLARIDVTLRRWVGAEGYAALLSRALAITAPTHPALRRISDLGIEPESTRAIPDFTDDETRDAIIALVATLMDLLGRIIGVDLAIRLMEQREAPSPRGAVSTKSEDAHDA